MNCNNPNIIIIVIIIIILALVIAAAAVIIAATIVVITPILDEYFATFRLPVIGDLEASIRSSIVDVSRVIPRTCSILTDGKRRELSVSSLRMTVVEVSETLRLCKVAPLVFKEPFSQIRGRHGKFSVPHFGMATCAKRKDAGAVGQSCEHRS